jgi:CBS domain containing-hemolysin-like protein
MDDGLPTIPGLLLVAALLCLNGLFVAAEFAFVAVRRSQIQRAASAGSGSARRVLGALNNLDYYVAAFQLGITMASIGLGWLGEPVIAHLVEPPIEELVGGIAPAFAHTVAIATAFLLVTSLHLIFGEATPKSIALQKPTGTAMWLSGPMSIFARVFGPVITVLNKTTRGILRLVGFDPQPITDAPLAAEDLAMSLESSASAGLISRRELSLARNTLRLSALTASDLMVPRNEVDGIAYSASREEILQAFAQFHHTRYPVYGNGLDDIVGVLNAKEIVLDWTTPGSDWRTHIRPPLVLPETVGIEAALATARADSQTLIVLADEFGGTAGIVSVFDIVEFLAGELPDEFEDEGADVRRLPGGAVVFSGLTHLLTLETDLDLTLPEVDAHTVGGLVMELLGKVPKAGDELTLDGYIVRVLSMDGNRVDQVMMTPRSAPERVKEAARER